MSLVTRCPVCATAFRVQRSQLAARGGKVRCGKCGQIFDGVAALVEEGSAEPAGIEPSPQLGLFDGSRRSSVVEDEAPLPAFMAEAEPNRGITFLWAGLALIALLLLGAQIVYHYRSEILAQFPGTRELLTRFCRVAKCEVTLPRRALEISIESSDLQADARRDGVYVLNALLKNRASLPQEYPALELTLLDGERPILRRVLTARDYLDAARPIEQGIAAGDEVAVRIYLEPSTGRTRATDYKLRHFYP
jgi:predicted Zn finger-like uncharacterized protein